MTVDKMEYQGVNSAEFELKILMRTISKEDIGRGERALAFSQASEIWEILPWQARLRTLEQFDLGLEDVLDFGYVAELVSGYRRRTVRRYISIWRRLVPAARAAWLKNRLSVGDAERLVYCEPEVQEKAVSR